MAEDSQSDIAGVGRREPRRVRVAVDRDDPHPELLDARDRAALVPPGADEEDGLSAQRGGDSTCGHCGALDDLVGEKTT